MSDPWTLEYAIEIARIGAGTIGYRSYAGAGGLWAGKESGMPDAIFQDWGLARATAIILNAAVKKQPRDEAGWLIEFKASVSQAPTYYGKTDDGLGMTTDHLAAIRFARKEDAQTTIDDIGWTEAQPVEHMWCSQ